MHIIWNEVAREYFKGVYISKHVIIFWKTYSCFYYILVFLFPVNMCGCITHMWNRFFIHMRINSAAPSNLQPGPYCKSISPRSDKLLRDLMPSFFSLWACWTLPPVLQVVVERCMETSHGFLYSLQCRGLNRADSGIFSALVLWASLLALCFFLIDQAWAENKFLAVYG